MGATSENAFLRSLAIGVSLVGIVLALLATMGSFATVGPGRGLRTLLLLGTPWFLALVPVLTPLPCWLTRAIWAVVVIWGGALTWLTLAGGLGFLILPLTLLYGALLGSTWTTQDLGDGGLCH